MENEQMTNVDLRHHGRVVWHWLWLIILAALIAGGGAFLVHGRLKPMYEASATLLIRERQNQGGLDYSSILMSERLVSTYSQMLKDTPVLDETIARVGLSISAEALGRMITVENVRDTLLINLKVRGPDPAQAVAIANTVVEVFAEYHGQIASASYSSSTESLDREMQQLQSEILAGQQALDVERAGPAPNSAEIARLEALVAQYRSTHADLLRSYEEIRVTEASASDALVLAKRAKVPTVPILPPMGRSMALAGAAGALLALGAAFLFEHLDDTTKDAEDVLRIAQLPVLGSIGRIGRAESTKGVPLMAAHPKSAAAEAYRLLRTNLFATLGTDGPAATVVVSSAGLQEGKTTTAANLGISLAQIGKQVLLVDSDLRRPALHTQFGLRNDLGLTSLFLEQAPPLEAVIAETGVKGLRLLTSGPIPGNPAELLEYPGFAAILAQLKESADYLILDSPPVLGVADAGILARKADAVLLVARAGRTRHEALRASVLSLQTIKVRVLGVVLNRANHHPGQH